jgi:hypothetical protein
VIRLFFSKEIYILGQYSSVATTWYKSDGQALLIPSLPPTKNNISWEGIEAVLKGVSCSAAHKQKLGAAITGIIAEKHHEGAKIHYIFEMFQQIKHSNQQGVRYPGVVHCEAALTSSCSSSGLAIQGNGISAHVPHLTKLEVCCPIIH